MSVSIYPLNDGHLPLSLHCLEELQPIAKHYPLLPVGGGKDGKAPLLKEWPKHPGYSIDQLKSVRGIRAVGVRTRPLLCFDFDGQSAVEYAIEQGRNPSKVSTWRINRDNDPWRFKLIFRLHQRQLAALPNQQLVHSYKTKPAQTNSEGKMVRKGEAEEIFCHPGHQVIVLGDHPSSGGHYAWPANAGPSALAELPPLWWKHVYELAQVRQKGGCGKKSRSRSRGEDWLRVNECPVCHRGPGNNPVCQLHRDEQTLRCFCGSTFHPPEGLSTGDAVEGTDWIYVWRQDVGWGEFAIFVKDKNAPIKKLRRWIHG